MEERGIAQGIWPQCKVNCLWPASASVQQLLARTLREIADGAGVLGNAILEVSIYATEGELLAHVVACLLERNFWRINRCCSDNAEFFTLCSAAKVSKAHLAGTVLTDESST